MPPKTARSPLSRATTLTTKRNFLALAPALLLTLSLLALPHQAHAWSGPTSGLINRWPLDDAHVSATTITDVVGGLNGTAGSGVTSVPGPVTQARQFNGNGTNAF